MQNVLNPKSKFKAEREFGELVLREGDKVMQIRNNYDIYWEGTDGRSYGSGVYNGDLGIVTRVTSDFVEVVFDDDKIVKYESNIIEELEHAYAITIHKSQGSEFKVVVIIITNGPPMLYTRNLLYTGVTRAKDFLIILGKEHLISRMIDNVDTKSRNTGLKYKLEKYSNIFTA
ncbi:MAG: ATP-dependent RecD-like DNA helicase [Clostridia bacterium]|nr:ATP-dependent RecD-like DNA helicase [Clostridia bacterium]